MDQKTGSAIERNAQTAIGLLVGAIIIYVGWQAQGQVARLDERVLGLQKEMEQMRLELASKMADRYYGHDARRDFELRDKRTDSIDKRVQAIEEKLWRQFSYRPQQDKGDQ